MIPRDEDIIESATTEIIHVATADEAFEKLREISKR